jgi:two-component sensor histidine kinase
MSLAAVQQHLSFSVGQVEVRPYLIKLCESLSASMMRGTSGLTLKVEADEASLSSHETVSLGLIVTELVINALKHAFPDGRSGVITVTYRIKGLGWMLSVSDNGVGRSPAAGPNTRVGLGTSIVEGLAKQLGGLVTIGDEAPGTTVVVVNAGGASGG